MAAHKGWKFHVCRFCGRRYQKNHGCVVTIVQEVTQIRCSA